MATTQVLQLTDLIVQIGDIQNRIRGLLGSEIFDYLFLFTRLDPLQINIESLSQEAEALMRKHNELSIALLRSIKINFEPGTKTVAQIFLETSRDIYLMRYLEARKEFAEYQLVRVPTQFERKLLDVVPGSNEEKLPATITIAMPDAFVNDTIGGIDLKRTAQYEAKDHRIKSYLSCITAIDELSRKLVYAFEDITLFGFVPVFYKDELLELGDKLCELCLLYFTPQVYAYIYAGRNPEEGKINVIKYYEKLTENAQTRFHPALKPLGDEIEQLIDEELRNFKQLYPETRTALKAEIVEILLFMIYCGDFVPATYFDIKFRSNPEFDTYEKRFHTLIDMYLIQDNGEKLPFPLETYNIDFTDEAKVEIFEAVTAGIVNPRLTLADYLEEQT